jgi:NitT/TauT family transport system substrate-binding protein
MRLLRLATALLAACVALVAPTGAADLVPLNVVVIPTDSAAQAFYALDMGFFRDAGFDAHVSAMNGSPAIITATVSGAMDVGNSTVGSMAQARARGIGARFIAPAGLWISTSPTAKLVVARDAALHAPADFTGKTIAVTGLADLTYYAARAWLDQNGVNSAGVKFIEIPMPEMVAALTDHRVDGAVLIEPFVAAAGDDVRAVAAVDDNVAKRFLATGWEASDAWLQAHPDLAARFAAVMKRTADWANTHRKESAEILLRHTKITPEVAARMVRATYGTTLDPALIQPVIDNASHYATFPSPITAADLIWNAPK